MSLKTIKNENGVYVELPKDKIEFVSKEAEIIYDLSLENDFLQQENQKLKEQLKELEESSANAINKQVARGIELVNQQKEFIEWLEEKIKVTEDKLDKYDELIMQGEETDIEYYESMINKGIFDAYKVCLSKYKNIVGGK